ncbi:MAG: ABC transporter substrate-binding protein [Myxococcales bacterium]|nr:ABC transporter substrate-binding protein [Myxococcales bacterium]
MPNDVDTLDPRATTETTAMRVSRLVHAGLTRLDPRTMEPVPYVAKDLRWESELSLWVTLRDDVRFHSGKPVDAGDVAATVAAFRASRHAHVVEPIERVDAVPGGVRVVLKRPHATLLSALELPLLRADQAAAPASDGVALDGLGPFAIARVSHGEIALDPARSGVGPTPARGVVVRTVRDENARALRLQAGRADLVQNGLSPVLLPALERDPNLAVISRPGANLTYMVLRLDRPPLDDVNLRRAIKLAIDRDRIARTLLGGHAETAHGLLPTGHWAARGPSGARGEHDVARARALVEAAGRRGTRLTLTTSTDRLRGSIARFVAQSLAEIGLEVTVVPLEIGTMLSRLSQGDFDLATLQLPELAEPNVLRVFLHSASIPPAGSNRGRVRDPDVDRLLDEGARARDLGERARIYAELDALVQDRALLLPLWHEDQVAVVSRRLAGYEPSAEGRWLGLAGAR